MEFKKVILCRGIQGSGKSTWAKAWALEDPEHRIRFNNDDIRNMLGKYWVPSREGLVADVKTQVLDKAMKSGFDIVIDNMNLNSKEVEYYETRIKLFNENNSGNYQLEFKNFFTPVEECIRRDSMRPNPIGEQVIRMTWAKYKQFIQTTLVQEYVDNLAKQSNSKPKAIVLDMDSTLCFNTTGRPWYGEGSSEGMLKDVPNDPIVHLAQIYANAGYLVFVITGRDTSNKEATEKWLENNSIKPTNIFYRSKGDFRKSAETKKEIIAELLKEYCIDFIIDDAEPVVEMYREMGLTVLQPNKTI